jgi:hypothetical protein
VSLIHPPPLSVTGSDPSYIRMDQQLKMSLKVPLFDGEDYVFWSVRMKRYLMSIGLEVWTLVEKGYDVSKVTPIEAEGKRNFGNMQRL